MVFFIWLTVIFCFKPERPRIDGLRERVANLGKELGPMNNKEKFVIAMVILVLALFMMKSFSPIPFFKNMTAKDLPNLKAPLLWVAGTKDPAQGNAATAFRAAPDNSLNRYVTVEASHAGVPNVAAPAVIAWLKSLQ